MNTVYLSLLSDMTIKERLKKIICLNVLIEDWNIYKYEKIILDELKRLRKQELYLLSLHKHEYEYRMKLIRELNELGLDVYSDLTKVMKFKE